jgi:tryptophan synthase alpha chain
MKSVSEQFQALRDRQQCALIPFVTAGDPDLATTAAALKTLDRNGADFLELGVPYSDPLSRWAGDSGSSYPRPAKRDDAG